MSKAHINKIFAISVWVFFVVSFLWMSKVLLLGYYPDFNTQYYVPKIVFTGENPYKGGSTLFTPQVYPPTEFLVFVPWTFFTLKIASEVYTIFSIISLFLSLFYLSKIFEIKFLSTLNLFLSSLAFISFPTKFTLGMGQINFFILILIVYSLWLLKKKKEFASGILLGASLAIKLFPVLLPVYFLVKLRKKILLGIAISFLVSTLLVIIFIPEKIYIDFISSVLPTLFSSWKLDYYNQALTGFIGRSFGMGEEAVILKSFSSVIIILATFFVVVYNKKKDFLTIALKIGVLITANLPVNTFSWQHHFVWLIIPFYASVFYLKEITVSKKEKSIYYGVLAISYFLISINFSHPQTLPLLFQSHVFFGAIILFFLQFKLLYDGRVNNKKRKSKTV